MPTLAVECHWGWNLPSAFKCAKSRLSNLLLPVQVPPCIWLHPTNSARRGSGRRGLTPLQPAGRALVSWTSMRLTPSADMQPICSACFETPYGPCSLWPVVCLRHGESIKGGAAKDPSVPLFLLGIGPGGCSSGQLSSVISESTKLHRRPSLNLCSIAKRRGGMTCLWGK